LLQIILLLLFFFLIVKDYLTSFIFFSIGIQLLNSIRKSPPICIRL